MTTLHGLFVAELKDIYNAEHQLLKAIPKLAKKAASPALKDAFTGHLKQTENQVERLNTAGKILGVKLTGKKCAAMEGLVKEGGEILEEEGQNAVIDAALIGAAKRVEHYEIAAYGMIRAMAQELGHVTLANLLQETLDEEGAADKKLTIIAEEEVLADANNPVLAADAKPALRS